MWKWSAAAISVLLVAGCGSGEGDGDGAAPIVVTDNRMVAAAAATLDAESARMTLRMTIDDLGMPTAGAVEMTAEGAFDFETGDGEMSLDMSSLLDAIGGAEAGALGIDADDLVMRIRSVDGVMYLDMGGLGRFIGSGAGWISIDVEELSEDLGGDLAGLGGVSQQADMTAFVEMLAAASDDYEELGAEDVRGVRAEHYRATIDLGDLLETSLDRLPESLRDRVDESDLRSSIERLGGVADASIPTDVWIDDDGLLRRMRMELDMSELAAGIGEDGAGAVAVEIDVFDYGVEVDVEAPPASEVTPFEDVFGGMGNLLGGGV